MEFEKSSGAVIYRMNSNEPKFLLLKNVNWRRNPPSSWWEFPKGVVEEGEKARETMIREVEEETSLADVAVHDELGAIEYHFRKTDGTLVKKEVDYYLAKAEGGDVEISLEHEDFRWLPYDKAYSTLKYENHRKILRKAAEKIGEIHGVELIETEKHPS